MELKRYILRFMLGFALGRAVLQFWVNRQLNKAAWKALDKCREHVATQETEVEFEFPPNTTILMNPDGTGGVIVTHSMN